MKYGFNSPPEDELKMSDDVSNCSDDSFEIVSTETCVGLDEVPTSSYKPLVTFHDMFDVYPIDSDIVARVSLTGGYVKSTEDTVIIMPIAWTSIDQAFHAIQLNGNFVKFDVKNLPKTSADKFFQLCYTSNDKTIVGVSAPFSFREVHEDELIEFQKEQNKEFWTFRSRFAVLMNIYWNSLVESKRSTNFEDLEVTSHETAGLTGYANSGSKCYLVNLTKSVNIEALTGSALSDNDLGDIKDVITDNKEGVCLEVPEKIVPFLKPCASMISVQQWQLVYDTLISVEEAIQFFETQMENINGVLSNRELFAPVDQMKKSTPILQEEDINENKFVLPDSENKPIFIKEEKTDETPSMHLSEERTIETSNVEENQSLQMIGFICNNEDIRRDQIDMLIKQILRKKMVLDQLLSYVRSSDRSDLYLRMVEKIYQLEVHVQTYKARTEEMERVNTSLINEIRDGEKEKMDTLCELKQLKADIEKVSMVKLGNEFNNYQKEHLNLSKKLRDTVLVLGYFKQLYQNQLQEKNAKDEAYGVKLTKFAFEKQKILNDFKKMKDDYEERLRQGAKEYAKLYLKYQKYNKPSDHTYAASRL